MEMRRGVGGGAVAGALLVCALLAGCGRQADDGQGQEKADAHGGGHGEESPSGASFKAGKGVTLTEETSRNLGVEVADVGEEKLPWQVRFSVQIFGGVHHHLLGDEKNHSRCDVHGSGFLSPEKAQALQPRLAATFQGKTGETFSGELLALEKALAVGEVEVVVGLTNATGRLKPGEFVTATVTMPRKEEVAVVPRSALLNTAEGTFVYAANGGAFLRTAVKTGAEADDRVEIVDGLLAGDQVVVRPVETFWMIELRATKGGGHSH